MNNQPPYNRKQVCEKLGIDLNQLKDVTKIHKGRSLIPIKNNDIIYEAKANSLTDDEFFRISKLSLNQIENEKFTINKVESEPNTFFIEKGTAFCKIVCDKHGVIEFIQKPLSYSIIELNHSDYVELHENSIVIDYLNNEKLKFKTIDIKSEKNGHMNILQASESIEDVYMTNDEVERLEKLIHGTLLRKKSSNKYREDAISRATINTILPELLVDKKKDMTDIQLNQLKFSSFEKLKSALEKDGCKNITYQKDKKKDNSRIEGKEKDGTTFHTTYEAYRKRFDALLGSYIAKTP